MSVMMFYEGLWRFGLFRRFNNIFERCGIESFMWKSIELFGYIDWVRS